ncbi:MAG: M14 metallopeptidase family protein [Bacteroidota bacterium]|nr:M14 metallopeptidase family protein [Bacteroidota bacterium]
MMKITESKNYCKVLINNHYSRFKNVTYLLAALLLLSFIIPFRAGAQEKITSPRSFFGFEIGADYHLTNYTNALEYCKLLEKESDRMVLEKIGMTAEGRPQYMAVISSPENISRLDHYRNISEKLALAKDLNHREARELAKTGKAVIWIDGGLHATEVCGSHQLIETIYRMVSRNDDETLRILDDVILLAVFANPDGLELVGNWYMRHEDPAKRSTRGLPRLYQKYIGHDNNRDSYMVTQPETENMSRIMYRKWFPQIMYNHHQSGPNGMVVFVPPFREPPNYNFDPLLVAGIQSVGLAMHNRLIAEGKAGSGMRSVASYSTWFNGNLRTTGYFHNQIGILTEIKGNPTPIEIEFNPDRQLPTNDMPYPVEPGLFPFRDAIEYSYTMNMAILDYASRYRETLLYNRYLMGRNNIEKGSRDNWTIHPDIIDNLKEMVANEENKNGQDQQSRYRRRGLDLKYMEYLRLPDNRDPRAYILPSDQDDFPTAVKFANTFIKNGVRVHRATKDFTVNGKTYPEGSLVFRTDQAFRPHILDLFEPQDYPDDFQYEGGPPNPPYDNAGYTLAYQMGIEFDRILDAVDGPFEEIKGMAEPVQGVIANADNAKGYLVNHAVNDAATLTNRLLAEKQDVYWITESLSAGGWEWPAGTIYIPSSRKANAIIEEAATGMGIHFYGIDKAPEHSVMKIRKPRIGLWDRYGGSMESGWTRFILEQFEFPYEKVFPKRLDEGELIKDFDVLVYVDRAIPGEEYRRYSRYNDDESDIPAEYRDWLGEVTSEETIPQLLAFLNDGGTIIAIGSSTNLAYHAGLPMSNHIVDSEGEQLGRDKYFIPSSILQVRLNNKLPLAWGMKERIDIFFDNSPVFRLKPDADKMGIRPVAWFDSDEPLRSGWAWGQDRLYAGTAMAEADVGKGKLYLFGPEILFRAQSHGTYKLFFNGLYLSTAEEQHIK